MNQNLFQKLNPLGNEFWKENPEEKFKQIVKLGYTSIITSFFAGIILLLFSAGFYAIIYPYYYGGWSLAWNYFSVYSLPIFNSLFLVYAFSSKQLTTFHKVFSVFFILSFLIDIIYHIEVFFYEIEGSIVYIIGIFSEMFYRWIIGILTIFVLLGKPSDLIQSMTKLFVCLSIISFLFDIIGRWLFLYESFINAVHLVYIFLDSFALLFFSYSLLSICHYRINIEPWDEKKIKSSDSSSAPEKSPSSISTESIAKIKALSELRDSGVFSDDEFEEQKAKIMSETNSTYVGSSEPIDDTFRILIYVVSFLIPIVGIVVGILYTMKPDNHSQEFGKMCLKIALASIAIGFILGILFALVIFSAY
jgi:hypothetical protein